MSNFVTDLTGLPFPKADKIALPSGADPTKYVIAVDWNAVCQALIDLRTYVLGIAGTLAPIAISGSASDLGAGAVPAARMPALTGDVTTSAGTVATTITAAAVTNAKLANMAANTVKGSVAGGVPADLSSSQGRTALGLATVAASGLASDLTGTLAAARLPAFTGDVTTTVGTAATTIAANAVTLAKIATQADQTILGNNTGGAASPVALTAAQTRTVLGLATVATSGSASDLGSGTLPAARLPAFTGDVTTTVGTAATTIAPDAVTNTQLANMANGTFKLRTTAGTGDPEDGTVAQALALLAVRLGEFGSAADGDATMDGAAAVTGYSLAGSTYTATGYVYFGNLTINNGITVDQRSWPGPICKGTCTNNGHVSWDGANASGQTAGAASVATGPLPIGTAGGNGGAVNGGNGSNGGVGAANAAPRGFSTTATSGGAGTISPAAVNPGVTGGVGHGGGGGGTLGNGGTGGGQSALSLAAGDWRQKHVSTVGMCPVPAGANTKLAAATGGGGGAGGGGINGGVGGGGGAGASYGVSKAFAYAGSGTWTANGGNGANGANASGVASDGGGGGGAGAGGIVVFVSAGTPPTATVTAGSIGNGGTGQTTGRTGGAGGAAGAGLTESLF